MAARCQVVDPLKGDACPKAATKIVTFADGSTARACLPCAIRLREMANAHGAGLRVEDLGP
jgi:hypothetical protein